LSNNCKNENNQVADLWSVAQRCEAPPLETEGRDVCWAAREYGVKDVEGVPDPVPGGENCGEPHLGGVISLAGALADGIPSGPRV
jgi:hypothetical protein